MRKSNPQPWDYKASAIATELTGLIQNDFKIVYIYRYVICWNFRYIFNNRVLIIGYTFYLLFTLFKYHNKIVHAKSWWAFKGSMVYYFRIRWPKLLGSKRRLSQYCFYYVIMSLLNTYIQSKTVVLCKT